MLSNATSELSTSIWMEFWSPRVIWIQAGSHLLFALLLFLQNQQPLSTKLACVVVHITYWQSHLPQSVWLETLEKYLVSVKFFYSSPLLGLCLQDDHQMCNHGCHISILSLVTTTWTLLNAHALNKWSCISGRKPITSCTKFIWELISSFTVISCPDVWIILKWIVGCMAGQKVVELR